MEKEYYLLDKLLDDCTVRIEMKRDHGTGFFVAPGLVLTCAHVIEDALQGKSSLAVYCNFNKQVVPVARINKEYIFGDAYPDLALLQVNVENHPCVLLGKEYGAFIDFYSYGFTKEHRDGESTTVECEGTQEDQGTWIKLKEGQVKPGSSGSPLLNTKTRTVCGMISRTRHRLSDLGGVALPLTAVFTRLPTLEAQNLDFHKQDRRWSSLLEAGKEEKHPDSVVAILFSKSKKIMRPRYFVGREDLLVEATSMLQQSCRVLLTGMAGIGKTALARVLAEGYLQSEKGAVLWVETKNESPDSILEAMANCLGDTQIGQLKHIDEKIAVLKTLLERSHAGLLENVQIDLLVLENVNNVEAADKVTSAVPDEIPVLITSRHRYVVDQILELTLFSQAEAIMVLEKTSGLKDLSNNVDALDLCDQLGYHPYALELAGFMMREVSRTPKELRRRLADAPLDLSSSTRGKLRALLDDSAANLDATTRAVLFAYGVFPSNGVTSDLLAAYLNKKVEELSSSLDDLVRRHLIRRRPKTEFFFMHDLTFYYVRSQSKPENDEDKQELVAGILRYLTDHRYEYDTIGMDLPNLLEIARVIEGIDLIKIVSFLTIGNYPKQEGKSYADQRGYSIGLIEQLDRAIDVARQLGDDLKLTTHYLLGKRGNAAFQRAEYSLAADKFDEELLLAPNDGRRVIVESILARTFAHFGQIERSHQSFENANKLAEQLNDDSLRGFVLEQESWAAGYLKDFEYERQIATRQLAIAKAHYRNEQNFENSEGVFYALLNLGVAELELAKQGRGDFKEAFQFHKEALELAKKHKSDLMTAYALTNLGEEYHYMGQEKEAISTLQDAQNLWISLSMSGNENYVNDLIRELNVKENHNEQDY